MPNHPDTWRDIAGRLTDEQVSSLEVLEARGQTAELLAVVAEHMAAVNDTERLIDDTERLVNDTEMLGW